MQTRLVKAIGPRAKEATVSTFPMLSLQICRAHAARAGYPKDFAVWQGRQQRRLLARTLDELRVRVAAGAADVAELPPPAKWAEQLLQRLARAKAKGDAPEDVADPLLSACYARYVEQMRAAGAVGFLDPDPRRRSSPVVRCAHADVAPLARAPHATCSSTSSRTPTPGPAPSRGTRGQRPPPRALCETAADGGAEPRCER